MRVGVALTALSLAIGLAGCGAFRGGAVPREVVVKFSDTASPQQHETARRNCSGMPNAFPEPAPTAGSVKASRLNDVRFRVDHASDYQLNQLYQCLIKQPGVIGVDIPPSQ